VNSLSARFEASATASPTSTLFRYRLQRISQRPALWAFAVALLFLCPFTAFGQTLHADLTNVQGYFNPTSTVTGSFDYNPTTGAIIQVAITETLGDPAALVSPVFVGDAPDSFTYTQAISPPYFAFNLVTAFNGQTCKNYFFCGQPYVMLTLPSMPTAPGTYVLGCYPIPNCGGAGWASGFSYRVTTGGNNGYIFDSFASGSIVVTQGSKALGTGSAGQVCCGDPVNPATGNMYMQVTDYETAGQNKLSVIRYYNSQGTGGSSFATTLGPVWRHSFDRYLRIASSSSVTAERADGRQVNFTLSGSTWTTDSDVDITLSNVGTTWTLTDHDDTVETYTTTSAGNKALLNSIQARNGYTQTLTHDSNGFLTSVSDSYSRSLTFSYSSGVLTSITTPESQNLQYIVSGTGGPTASLTQVQYPTSPTTHVTYAYGQTHFPYAITSLTDENGNTYSTWTYDAQGRATSSQLGGGANAMTFAYNSNGTTTVTNALGVADTYTFTTLQGVKKVSQISRAATGTTAAATESFGYDSNGYLNSVTDWNGNQTTYTNNSHGQPTTINEAVGSSVARTTTISYDATFVHLPDSIATPGVTTGFTYDGSGDVLTRKLTDTTTQSVPYSTNGQTRTWTNTWSNFLLASVKNPNNNTTTFGYDSTGALTSITDAKSHVTNITSHTGGGLPKTIVDPNGATNGMTTTLSYDPRQRLTSKAVASSAGTHTTTYTLDSAGNLTKVTLPDNSYIAYVFDAAHRITKATNALGEYQTYTLNALGNATQVNTYDSSNAQWRQQAQTFDALGRQLTYVGGGTLNATTYTYDNNGNALTVKDGNNHTTTRVFDALNRLSTSTDANAGLTQFAYDAHDRTTSVTDANSHATTYVYDGFGDNIQIVSPDTGTANFYYDANANLTGKSDGAGSTTNLSYDALDRITGRTYPADSAQNVYYNYDQTWGSPLSNNEIGRLSYIDESFGHVYFAYDPFGNVAHRERTNTSFTDINDIWITHDAADRVAGVAYPSGLWVAQNRDAAGQVNNVNIVPPGASSGTDVDWVAYAPFFGPLRYETSGNNMRDVKNPDQDYRTNAFAIQSNGGSTNLINETLTYDAANNLTSVADSVNAYNNQTLAYDVINRLTSATSGSGGYGSLAWAYDKLGNISSQTVNSSTTTYSYSSGTNRLASITNGGTVNVTTNGNGNITSIPPANSGTAATFAYNVANRLASVTGSPLAGTFVYNGFGERYSKQNPGSNPIIYTYDLDGNVIEENNNGSVTDYIYNSGVLVGLWVPGTGTGTTYYVHTNPQGTPLMVTNGSSTVVWSTTYQPYGTTSIPVGSVTQNVRLPGQFSDVETGFNYNGFRDYMPNLGRYLEADPIGLGGGTNPYLYAGGNPLGFTDRQGLKQVTLYRVVTNKELSDLHANNGQFRSPSGNPKYFSTTPQGAACYARQAFKAFPQDGPYTLVTSTISSDDLTPGMLASVDGGISTIVVPDYELSKLSAAQVEPTIPIGSMETTATGTVTVESAFGRVIPALALTHLILSTLNGEDPLSGPTFEQMLPVLSPDRPIAGRVY
jgi:RHS repeat-associated protein